MAENAHTGKWQNSHTRKMTEHKLHDLENGRKYTYRSMAENAHTENDRTENAGHGKWQNGKCMIRKMAEITHTGK